MPLLIARADGKCDNSFKKVGYNMNKTYSRIISVFILITLLIHPLSVYASGDTLVDSTNIDSLIDSYADQIKEQTVKLFNTYDTAVDSVGSLWSGFITVWKSTKATAYYGLSVTKLIAGLSKDFVVYLKDNYFFGYFDNGEEYHYIAPDKRFLDHIHQITKSSELVPSENSYPIVGYENYIYNIGFKGNFPFNFGDNASNNIQNKVMFSTSPYNNYPECSTLVQGTSGYVTGYLQTISSAIQNGYAVYYRVSSYYSSDSNSIIINPFESNSSNIRIGTLEFQGTKLYILNSSSCSFSRRAFAQQISGRWNYTPYLSIFESGAFTSTDTGYTTPFYFYGNEFFSNVYGNATFAVNGHQILYYNGQFFDVTNNYTWDSSQSAYYIDMSGIVILNDTVINNAINNYNNTINNIINNYNVSPDYLLYIINDYINQVQNGIDYSEYFENINERLDLLEQEFQEIQEDLNNMAGTLVKIKNYCKSIDTILTNLFNKFDSLFTSSGLFFLDVKLDYMYNHLSQDMTNNTNRIINAINNINVSSNGGGGDINFGDFIVDIDASLNLLFTLNNEQKTEIETDIDTIKVPFSWIGTLGNNINTLLTKMVNRSAYYSGDSVTGDFGNFGDIFDTENEAVAVTTDTRSRSFDRVPVGTAAASSSYPVIYLHFGNSTSDFNYGGDVPAIDFSWYAPYKSTVDTVIVIFAWAFAVICFYRSLPSLLDGGSAKENKGDN